MRTSNKRTISLARWTKARTSRLDDDSLAAQHSPSTYLRDVALFSWIRSRRVEQALRATWSHGEPSRGSLRAARSAAVSKVLKANPFSRLLLPVVLGFALLATPALRAQASGLHIDPQEGCLSEEGCLSATAPVLTSAVNPRTGHTQERCRGFTTACRAVRLRVGRWSSGSRTVLARRPRHDFLSQPIRATSRHSAAIRPATAPRRSYCASPPTANVHRCGSRWHPRR
jgi:hypothetical protein